ncbi:amidase [Paraburkholderia lacunae]|nr:amidase [Paraburkholderia lacunae]
MSFKNAREMTLALQAREISAVELFDEAVARIERYDAKTNAVVVRDFERARLAAAAADAALMRGDRRPLLGVPMTVKESFSMAGLPKTWGVPGTETIRIDEDAVAVRRLKNAGAVILGKTNVATMLGDWQTYNPVYGVTSNPWDLTRTPGGSSGGSAAALAAGFVPLELGSDIYGSLRVPAHCCGIYAHKPSHGLVPLRGAGPPGSPMLSVSVDPDLVVAGPMSRSAGDLALALDVLAGPDDAQAAAYRLELPPSRHTRLADFRVLMLEDHPVVQISNEVRAAMRRFRQQLEGARCTVGTGSALLPDLGLVMHTLGQLFLSFMGADMPLDDYRALQEQAAGLPGSDTSDAAMELRGLVLSHRDWIAADRARVALMHQWRQLFREWDLVLCPVLPTPAFTHDHSDIRSRRLEIDGRQTAYTHQALWQSLATLTGLPATAFPIGLGESGLPIGLQAIGPYLEDRTPIAFAELAEREFGGFVQPPAFAES